MYQEGSREIPQMTRAVKVFETFGGIVICFKLKETG
jgi:hypothetical protein